MKKVLVLEDESSIRSFVVINLKRSGYEPIEAETGEQALEQLKQNPDIKVALLDVMLPDIDGFEVCRRIRATDPKLGIIMLTAKAQEMDKVTGLMTGADDYVTKPFNPLEVKGRIKAIIRRTSRGRQQEIMDDRIIEVGDLRMDLDNRRVTLADKEINLTGKEFELLELLATHAGKVYSRSTLLQMVWGKEYPGDVRTVDVHIRRLREKIESNASEPRYVQTKWGVGYYYKNV